MYKQDSCVWAPSGNGQPLHIRSLLYGNRCASYDSGKGWNRKHRNSDHNVYHTRSDNSNNCDCKQDVRKMQKHITASHDQGINKTAVETSDQSQNNAAGCSDNCSDQSAGKGQSGTYHQTAEYILAKLICTPV